MFHIDLEIGALTRTYGWADLHFERSHIQVFILNLIKRNQESWEETATYLLNFFQDRYLYEYEQVHSKDTILIVVSWI